MIGIVNTAFYCAVFGRKRCPGPYGTMFGPEYILASDSHSVVYSCTLPYRPRQQRPGLNHIGKLDLLSIIDGAHKV